MSQDGFEDGYAVTVAQEGGGWVVREFDDSFDSLETSVNAVRNLRSEGAAFAILNVEEDFLVIVRPGPSRTRLVISDATMAVDDDFAAEIAHESGIEIPDIDPADLDDVDGYPDGDFEMLEDIGLNAEMMGVLLDPDDDPHVVIERIADHLGFAGELEDALD
ncbi:tRNA adenosine deaminase-associated protein [Corynebacterium qintianiae]|uniref:tRNA adenosine deaminase-associated protein n=1 Tax=Corynebacterium qintianiae TaxID=2709392 RepID=UPI0013EC0538|nr:tRNA adenosine deaminase-associated protein [Corynebacterium qintianiae]